MATEMTVIPLPEAARRLRLDPDVLTRLVQSDKLRVRAVITDGGQILVHQGDIERMAKAMALRDKIWAKVVKFENETVSTLDAKEVFGLNEPTIYRCIKKGYIRAGKGSKGGRGKKRDLNKADVAYISELAKHVGGGRGHRLFTPDTIPPHAMN